MARKTIRGCVLTPVSVLRLLQKNQPSTTSTGKLNLSRASRFSLRLRSTTSPIYVVQGSIDADIHKLSIHNIA